MKGALNSPLAKLPYIGLFRTGEISDKEDASRVHAQWLKAVACEARPKIMAGFAAGARSKAGALDRATASKRLPEILDIPTEPVDVFLLGPDRALQATGRRIFERMTRLDPLLAALEALANKGVGRSRAEAAFENLKRGESWLEGKGESKPFKGRPTMKKFAAFAASVLIAGSTALASLISIHAAAANDLSTPPMTLADCVKEALANNPGLRASAAKASAIDHAADAARAVRFPRVDLASDYNYSDRPQRQAQPSYQGEIIRFDNDIAQTIAEIRVPLFSGGRLVARQKAAELAAAAGRFNLQGSRQDLVLNVTAAYLAAIEQKSVIKAIDASLDALKEQLKVAEAMKEVGRIAPLDLLKVEVRAAAVEQRRSKARRDGELMIMHLGTLLGRDPQSPLPVISDAPSLPPLEVSETLVLLSEAMAHSPGVNALRQEVARRRAELSLVKSERWPSLDAFGRWTMRSVVSSAASPIPASLDFFTAGVILKLPLWTSGETAARRRQAEALLQEALEDERAFELQIKERIQREAAALAEAYDRSRVAEKAVGQAREAFEIERANYELGRAAVNDILDAQAALLDAELALAQARHDVAYTTVALAWAAGRDLEKWLMPGEGDEK